MNNLDIDKWIASLDIPQIIALMKRLLSELYERYMSEAE